MIDSCYIDLSGLLRIEINGDRTVIVEEGEERSMKRAVIHGEESDATFVWTLPEDDYQVMLEKVRAYEDTEGYIMHQFDEQLKSANHLLFNIKKKESE